MEEGGIYFLPFLFVMKKLKQGLTIRGDSLYCPLAFGLDSYYNCSADCVYCYCRALNHTWGLDFRYLDIDYFKRQILNGLKNPNPKSYLAQAIKQKKTLRFGNKSDPFQPLERKYRVSKQGLEFLNCLNWEVKIETKFQDIMLEY